MNTLLAGTSTTFVSSQLGEDIIIINIKFDK